jgi:Na+-transporting NADH:ubiquinone oxidoreductase subunit C
MKKALQTIGFMMLITAIFISILAFVNESSQARITQNLQLDRYKSKLYAFQIFPQGFDPEQAPPTLTTSEIPWDENNVLEVINNQIKKISLPINAAQKALLKDSFLQWSDSVEVYVRLNEKDEITAYGFPFKGKGLWGTITAFGVISADLEKMIGIDFTDQVETPGLGARITEHEFKQFFTNLDLDGFSNATGSQPPIIMIRQKEKTNIEESTNELQAITGATQTCDGVLKMVNTDIAFYLKVLKEQQTKIEEQITQIPDYRIWIEDFAAFFSE